MATHYRLCAPGSGGAGGGVGADAETPTLAGGFPSRMEEDSVIPQLTRFDAKPPEIVLRPQRVKKRTFKHLFTHEAGDKVRKMQLVGHTEAKPERFHRTTGR